MNSRFLLSIVISAALAAPVVADSTDELAGLWKAKRRFGPDARGPLVIQKTGTTYTADMIGRTLPVRIDAGELTFDLANGQGTFRGKVEKGEILGHWFPPSSNALLIGFKYASPVRLARSGSEVNFE